MTTAVQRDALKELVSIGSGNALTSLNRLLGRGRISLSVPECVAGELAAELGGLDRAGVGVHLSVDGEVDCTVLTVFDEGSARRVAGVLLGRDAGELGALAESALIEAVNIISCTFLGALGTMVQRVLIPGPPAAEYGRLADLVRGHARDVTLTTVFDDATVGFSGRILVLVDDPAARAILSAVGVAA